MILTKKLIKKIVKQDRKVIKQLYEHLYPKMISVAFYYKLDDDKAQELFNISFLKVIQKIETFNLDDNSKFEAWARRIMSNSIFDELRKMKRERDLIIKKKTKPCSI